MSCWDGHLPIARHRDAWAEEKHAPATAEAEEPSLPSRVKPSPKKPARRVIPRPAPPQDTSPEEVLIVASRLKDFVKAASGFNTSDRVLEPLSEIVRRVCLEAIENARRDGRKTLLDRDVPKS